MSAALLGDVLDALRDPGFDLEACVADAGDVAALRALVPAGVPVTSQGGGDLGARMAGVVAGRLASGRPASVLVGADCPSLGPADVHGALRALRDGADVAVSPSSDGGYSLVALARPAPAVFAAVPWSGPEVLAVTRRRAAAAGLRIAELAPVDDVDRYDDLVRLAGRLGRAGAPAAPRTRRVLARVALPRGPVTGPPPAGRPAPVG